MMPAWTFAASAHAAAAAGLVPFFVDVELDDWTLDPRRASAAFAAAPATVGAVMPVAPFGLPIDLEAWAAFGERHRCAVVADAAASIDVLRSPAVPAVVSLHATKALGIGEGGFVACRDRTFIDRVRRLANFGFLGSREAAVVAWNAKLSEYAAAVGLAGLDEWPSTREAFARVANDYVCAVAPADGVTLQPEFGARWVSSTVNVRLPDGTLDRVEAALDREGFDTRRWWGGGLTTHAAFRDFPRAPAPNTALLARSVLGLPCSVDLRTAEIEAIARIVRAAAARSSKETVATGPKRASVPT